MAKLTWFVASGALTLLGMSCSADDSGATARPPVGGITSSTPAIAGTGVPPSAASGTGAAAPGVVVPPAAGTPAAIGGRAAPPLPIAGTGATAPNPTPVPTPAGQAGQPATMVPSGPMTAPDPSAGCNQADWPPAGNAMIDVDGTQREYISKLPANYDPKKPYRLVFAWHGLGGSAMQVSAGFGGGYYSLATTAHWANEAIFIAGQGLPTSTNMDGTPGGAGWPNTGGRDVAFVKKLVEFASNEYCVDRSRIFSTGMSYGGIMSNTLGCEMGDVFRAIAPMSGSGPRSFGGRMCVGQVAVWMSHGDMDTTVPTMSGQASRDYWAMANHCTTMTAPVAPEPCVAYQGCDAGHPVTWCQFAGGHTIPPFATQAIFDFFSQF